MAAALVVAGFVFLIWLFAQGGVHQRGVASNNIDGGVTATRHTSTKYDRLPTEEDLRCSADEAILLRDGTEILIPAECSR
jgi:hypothetical protein